jgi:hypothetical protein
MTVKELIAALQAFNGDIDVVVEHSDMEYDCNEPTYNEYANEVVI